RSAMPTSLNQATAITPPPLQGRGSGGGGRPRTARHSPLPTLSPEGERAFSYQSPSCVLEHALVLEDGHHPATAVDADALPVPDPLRRLAGADHRREAVLARDDRHVAHGSTDVRHGAADLLEDRRPGRVGHLAHEDVALL